MILTTGLRVKILSALVSRRMLALRRWYAEWRRRLAGQPHTVSVFVELDDPYSCLLCNYLPELQQYYAIELKLHLTEALLGPSRPAPELYHEYALTDCKRLARELGVPFLDKGESPPVEYRRLLLDWLAQQHGSKRFNQELLETISLYWRGDAEALGRRVRAAQPDGSAKALLDRNRRRLRKLGHYNTAMLHYGGEWYWGVDRLHHLVSRLDDLGAASEPGLAPRIASIHQVMRASLPFRPPAAAGKLPPLECFYALQSPYSWIALERIIAIADSFGVELQFRPVLPMLMRGMPQSLSKLRYIVLDVSREARERGIGLAGIADLAGAGVERCMAVWQYAKRQQRERDFLYHVGEAIWIDGIDLSTDNGLRKVTTRAGLLWPGTEAAIKDEAWRDIARQNHESLLASGCWGVPTFRIGDWVTWGQDRDWLVARHLEELCEDGDGIMT